jgi:hypothetical protein
MKTPTVNVLFVDIGNVLLTNGWNRVNRRRAAEKFALDIDESTIDACSSTLPADWAFGVSTTADSRRPALPSKPKDSY